MKSMQSEWQKGYAVYRLDIRIEFTSETMSNTNQSDLFLIEKPNRYALP